MSLKCLNCHMVCAADDTQCVSCGYQITNTSAALKKGSGGALNMKFAMLFMVIGSAIFNSVLAPKWYPSTGSSINMERVWMAALVGAVCAVLGGLFGSMITDRD